MSRITACFQALSAEGRGAFIPYLEAFDPDRATSQALLEAMPAAGADLIEIGIPFSDPVADGPVIQASALRGLRAGVTLAAVLEMVRQFRKNNTTTPIILMGYVNPIEIYGYDRFCCDAVKVGVDGVIVVDLPPEESGILKIPAERYGLDIIRLVTPTTTEARLAYILTQASGFVYYVSIAGVTGTHFADSHDLQKAISRIRTVTSLPIVIGFGVRTPQHIQEAVAIADGAVVASALLETLAETLDHNGRSTERTLPAVLEQIKTLAQAVQKSRN
ncbi:MAG: tryptophan synthase subunit alpha [Acetobacter sp.]|nr:tryptophan synthase subunit alpha [Acetobacter sp.]MBO6043418.1 tryptophan synthase subunit alpha [Acetobacter sp.]MBO6091163.1 tryptophan synthase subunit alpha [Acetobacter sp.]MBQ5545966.1 tryptophan synthase subunit alpha [Acetobacter sp.]MBQ5773815.1 tryptophan synthase subunit alpha [Acetobacter sp.]